MRLLVDYRPALRARTGVGEWVHQLVRALLRHAAGSPEHASLDVSLFVSSWKDRPSREAIDDLPGARLIDRRIPVRWLTRAWNRLSWPPVDLLTGRRFDATFSATPLVVPTLAPATVVTVHDFDFLDHPDRTWAEMRADFPVLIARHLAKATLVAAISRFTASEATRRLQVPPGRIVLCRPGVPDWILKAGDPPPPAPDGYILFVGTLEARKNPAGLVRAYMRLRDRRPEAPRLVLAGARPPEPDPALDRALAGPAAAQVELRGYLDPAARRELYAGARMLVLASHMEGFGLPVLEAMALGVPVVVSDRGALPEVAGDAGVTVPAGDEEALAAAMHRVLSEPGLAEDLRARGLARASAFSWDTAAGNLLEGLHRVRHDGGLA